MKTLIHTHHANAVLDEQGVATLTLTNAKSMNILGTPAIDELQDALSAIAADPGVRVLVLRGSGDKAFIGGADIHELAALNPETGERFITRLRDFCEALRTLPVPVIARLSGWCLGGGLEVAMACDLRISSTDARYGMPEVHVGIPSVIHAALMPRLIGSSRATWMLLTGDDIDARTAKEWGLIHTLHEPAVLDDAIHAAATKFLKLGPAVLRQQKELLRSWEELPLRDAVDASVRAFGQAFATGEPQKFMEAFKSRKRSG